MEANELRIGNIICSGANPKDPDTWVVGKVYSIGNVECQFEQLEVETVDEFTWFFKGSYFGFPIDEVILKKLGFEKVYESNYRIKYDYIKDYRFGYDVNKALKNLPEGVSFRGEHYTEIKYVHQLQNLYFALTGKELTLNDL